MKKNEKTNKKRIIKQIMKYTLLLLLVAILVHIGPAFFYSSLQNHEVLPAVYRKGVYHVHSVYSDGRGTVADITRAASELGLDFVVLTDHGRPNLPSAHATCWYKNVLLIGGSEFSLNCGHLAVMGFNTPDYLFPPEPQEAINEVISHNPHAVCFLAHPFDNRIAWTDWDIHGFSGLEVLSSYSEARKMSILKFLVFPLTYAINKKYALLNTLHYPETDIRKWDQLNQQANLTQQYSGIYALDAHAKIPITKKMVLAIPTYKAMFALMTVYVRTSGKRPQDAQQAAAEIIQNIKLGRFFNVLEAIGPANGFDAYFWAAHTGQRLEMGGATTAEKGKIMFTLPPHITAKIILYQNGQKFKQLLCQNETTQAININEKGVYRLEVYAQENRFSELPWIITNPFYLGMTANPPSTNTTNTTSQVTVKQFFPENDWNVEKNSGSTGALSKEGITGVLHFTFLLGKATPKEVDFWSVLALRQGVDWSPYQGVVLEVKGNKEQRFWVELRTGEDEEQGKIGTRYHHSFLVTPEWQQIVIPFEKFHAYFGSKQKFDKKRITAVFIGINNVLAYEGATGELLLKNSGLY